MSDRSALITGASGAIGTAIARSLASAGFKLALHCHERREGIEALATELPVDATVVQGDVTRGTDVEAMFAEASDVVGPPTVLVHSAGILRDGFLAMMKESSWDDCVDVSLKGAYLCTKQALRSMTKAKWGRIVYIGSTAGLTGDVSRANYSAAKAGLIGLARSVAREVGRGGITANVVCPGVIESPMTADMNDKRRTELLARIPIGRMGEPAEVAELVRYLVSDGGGYVTGAAIPIDGGLSM
jgi:3-oxoacyl-[acyl-carrier protein] reductase